MDVNPHSFLAGQMCMRCALQQSGPDTADSGSTGFDPCVDEEASAYLNRPDVQSALHVADTGSGAPPRHFSLCNPDLRFSEYGTSQSRPVRPENAPCALV